MSIQIDGIVIAMLEIFIFFGITITLKDKLLTLRYIDSFSYYWLCFTILTGIWEFCYIVNYYNINKLSQNLITNHEHSWTNEYTIEYILPNKVANIFYAEYGAWADREYMSDDYWARVIEGTHFGLCGLSALTAMVSRIEKINRTYIIFVMLSMGTQLMNSILYITQYIIQINDKNSKNNSLLSKIFGTTTTTTTGGSSSSVLSPLQGASLFGGENKCSRCYFIRDVVNWNKIYVSYTH